jgi:outer membrane murein-binding lipoprotein Lpp
MSPRLPQGRTPIRRDRRDPISPLALQKVSVREEDLRQQKFCLRSEIVPVFLLALVAGCSCASAQTAASDPAGQALAQSVDELRQQVQELRAAVAEIKSEASQYRAESDQLRKELESMRAGPSAPGSSTVAEPAAGEPPTSEKASVDQRLSSVEESTQLMQSELRSQYQTKVESASKYRARISGLVLFNLFGNYGPVDNMDVPTYAAPTSGYGAEASFGATLRQSELGLEVFGPTVHGAKTSGQVQFDFGGGFPNGALDGINTGIVRLRTASVHLDWQNTSIIAGQDNLFISPNSPTSFASLLTPSFGYSGNLWAWTPQLRIEHRLALTEDQNISVQAGILDNLTSELSNGVHRQPQAGESSGQPAYAFRTAWNGALNSQPVAFGVSAYYSPQDWGFGWKVKGWAVATDWRIPLHRQLELSGEFYRGKAVGGIGGGIGQSLIFSGNPADPTSFFRPVNSAGGWSQLKFSATSRLEFNGVFGLDNPFSADVHAFVSPLGPYQAVLAANRSEMMNFIFRPRSDLLISGEYRHLQTSHFVGQDAADQVNFMMGVLF